MSVTVELDLPEGLVRQAREMGLLDNRRVAELLADEVRRRNAGQELKKALDDIRSVSGEPLTMDEIDAEIKAARARWVNGHAGQSLRQDLQDAQDAVLNFIP